VASKMPPKAKPNRLKRCSRIFKHGEVDGPRQGPASPYP
jgi:hypothetical protein